MRLGERRKFKSYSHLYSRTLTVNLFRLCWIVLVIWGDWGVYHWSLSTCKWPELSLTEKSTHVLLVSDPQVQHPLENEGGPSLIGRLRRLIFDMNLRKSWGVTTRMRPHVVIFLGDMLASGRHVKDEIEYERHAQKFKSIFQLHPSTSVFHIPGNNDVGMGVSPSFSRAIRGHYTELFGPFNQQINIHNHTFLLIDAPGLVDEDYQRAGHVGFDKWSPLPDGTVAFVKSTERDEKPLILLTHIPLARPDSASCGPLREQGTIRRGVGHGYQNTLGKQTTAFLLQSLQPSAVYSGDNRDYCEYIHTAKKTKSGHTASDVREVTVKSFSMANYIRHPGFQLLSLINPTTDPNRESFRDTPCQLPDQYGIYTGVYLPFFFLTVLALAILSLLRRRHGRLANVQPLDLSTRSSGETTPDALPESAIWSPFSPVASSGHRSLSNIRTPSALSQPAFRTSRPATPIGSPLPPPLFYSHDDDEAMYPPQYAESQGGGKRLEEEQWSAGHNRGGPEPLTPHFQLAPGHKSAARRGWSYSWTFVFRGRRRRMTISAPTLSLLNDLVELVKGDDYYTSTRQRLLRTTLRDIFSIFWFVGLIWILLSWQWMS
ncbi:hypothetical protein H0H92_009936 [Tricholoma furcatifolium]|nr:hypothetical protein H0H92_009936 [Tricholoma furcatifolium]